MTEAITDSTLPTPCFVFSQPALEKNMTRIAALAAAGDCRVLLAFKGFAVWRLFPYFSPPLSGAAVSSLAEATLAAEYFPGDHHAYSPAFQPREFPAIARLCSHIVFNSHSEWRRWQAAADGCACGVRINPGFSEVANPLYNPCLPKSQFGIRREEAAFLPAALQAGELSGVHLHALCEQNADSLTRVAAHVHEHFGDSLRHARWLNLGGGHLLADDDYDSEQLLAVINDFRARYEVEIYLEPSGGVVSHCCRLHTSVLDIRPDNVAVLDASASAHVPDTIEAPYQPAIVGAQTAPAAGFPHRYRLCGSTCMAGDVFGDYYFPAPLVVGEQLMIDDVAAYTLVKSTCFNGVAHPALAVREKDGTINLLREFSYADYRARMA